MESHTVYKAALLSPEVRLFAEANPRHYTAEDIDTMGMQLFHLPASTLTAPEQRFSRGPPSQMPLPLSSSEAPVAYSVTSEALLDADSRRAKSETNQSMLSTCVPVRGLEDTDVKC